MPHIVTALFENHAQAHRALQAMMEAGMTRDRIALVGGDQASEVSSISGFRELSARDDTLVELQDLPLPEEDLRQFEQGLRRGCALLSARVDQSDLEQAIQVIEMFDPLDLDRHSREWTGEQPHRNPGVDAGAPLGAGLTGGTSAAGTNVESVPGMGSMADDPSLLGTSDRQSAAGGFSDPASSTMPTGQRRAEERAGAPRVLELAAGRQVFRRETNRSGRVRAYTRD